MIRNLYHGSNTIIEKPKFGYGKRYNDYGLGFYCTDSLQMAKEWGASVNQNGYANCYELDCDGLSVLDLNGTAFCIGWQSCWKTGSLMFPLAWRWKPRIIFARIFLWTTRAAMLSSAIAQMTVTFPLRRTLSMGPFPIASLTTLCT